MKKFIFTLNALLLIPLASGFTAFGMEHGISSSQARTVKEEGLAKMKELGAKANILSKLKPIERPPRTINIKLDNIENLTQQQLSLKKDDKTISIPAQGIDLTSIRSNEQLPKFQITDNQDKVMLELYFNYKEGVYTGEPTRFQNQEFEKGDPVIYFSVNLAKPAKKYQITPGKQANPTPIAGDYKIQKLKKHNANKNLVLTYLINLMLKDLKGQSGTRFEGYVTEFGASTVNIVGPKIVKK